MTDYAAALGEIKKALKHSDLWLALGSWDVRRMYRRSVLGPLWLAVSSAVFVGGIGALYGVLLKQPLDVYLPHIAIGYIVWLFASGTIVAGTTALVNEGAILKQVAIGTPVVILRVLWRQILIALHQSAVPLLVLAFFHKWPGVSFFWVIPGLALLLANVSWMTALLAIVSARYRDIPPIVASVLQIVFFLTPVIWPRDRMQDHLWLVDLNPFAHLTEIVRAPLVGGPLPLYAFAYCAVMAGIGAVVTFIVFARTRDRLVYWL
jgi:ABC-type polysaccharide/polyol phosphate export permease